ncbi:MAG: type II toxin-antitoxin system RelE/ParE family toxin [Calditrichaeota bacterium]|nr:type II toxin-antitoxin system RelE/ParE family toxin [Calditrichota bacterium]HQU72360.1 type II toxin-antitoxin system RelE/ParE family toxin [Calditrichia bacterium]
MASASKKRRLLIYQDIQGKEPLTDWLTSLKDKTTRQRIYKRIDRMENGNFGDHKSVGEGIWELRIFIGGGYRIYFAESKENVVLLLCGGEKNRQQKDIITAREYWMDYQRRAK